jgi:hypothetical protein
MGAYSTGRLPTADIEIACKECGRQGAESTLENHTDASGDDPGFSFCPECGSTDLEKIAKPE